jgi:hypothetical protein
MKALSIRQPWAFAILHLGKRIENRSWWCGYRGPILIHAGKWWDTRQVVADFEAARRATEPSFLRELRASLPDGKLTHAMLKEQTGGFVGQARIVGCLRPGDTPPAGQERWYQGEFGILLADVEPLPALVPYRGALGIFDVPEGVVT